MKKVLAFLIASVLLIAAFAIPTAAVDISPVTKYEDAKSGDLLYPCIFLFIGKAINSTYQLKIFTHVESGRYRSFLRGHRNQ